ncbi:SOS response-associated peptidase family protein [uncultured Ramlibacter sp.]|uniref:SOS response-associated peptidase family protein n=1 Tax=uncultured Ramlibacter sp. TaxID=260755 RepID=UPI00261FFB5D|nr:SOS response-associated peptidase family protein [uncultured Ramlibacter sp.]
MCNLYESTPRDKINMRHLVKLPEKPYPGTIAPLKPGPFVKADGASDVGQWGLIPDGSPSQRPTRTVRTAGVAKLAPMSTNNTRQDKLTHRFSIAAPIWARGQRCLIPADTFQEPYWGPLESPFAKSIARHFRRADGQPWALAGIWNDWTDPETGEVVGSYSMITQNCDTHLLLRLMHRPEVDPKTKAILPADQQDKRAVVPLEEKDWDAWLHGIPEQAMALIHLPALEVFLDSPTDPEKQVALLL